MDTSSLPRHIGFIMDGNRRWARERGLPTLEGHRRGYEIFKKVGQWCLARGVTTCTVYAFSTENWNRSKEEVAYLMDLLVYGLQHEIEELIREGIRLRVIGGRTELPDTLQRAIEEAEQATAKNDRGTLFVAVNYGGRQEIVDAARSLATVQMSNEKFTIAEFQKHLYVPETPEVDMVIRTGGEQRLSGFLLWQAAYAELYFTPTYWPDFSEADLDAALAWYASRERRFGT